MDRDSLLFKQGGEPGHNGVNDLQEYILYNKHTHCYFHFEYCKALSLESLDINIPLLNQVHVQL